MAESREIVFRGKKASVFEVVPKVEEIPDLFFYGIRHSDDDWDGPITIEKLVVCNRWGVIGFERPLEESMFGESGCIELTEEERDLLLDR